jgi:hypothetical protein
VTIVFKDGTSDAQSQVDFVFGRSLIEPNGKGGVKLQLACRSRDWARLIDELYMERSEIAAVHRCYTDPVRLEISTESALKHGQTSRLRGGWRRSVSLESSEIGTHTIQYGVYDSLRKAIRIPKIR